MSDAQSLRAFHDAIVMNQQHLENMKQHLYRDLYPGPPSAEHDERWTAETGLPPLDSAEEWNNAAEAAGLPPMVRSQTTWPNIVAAVRSWAIARRVNAKPEVMQRSEHVLTAEDVAILMYLAQPLATGSAQVEVADGSGYKPTVVKARLALLRSAGYVATPDGRKRRGNTITDAGRQALERVNHNATITRP